MSIDETIKSMDLMEVLGVDEDVEENIIKLARTLNLETAGFDRLYFYSLKILAYGFYLGKDGEKTMTKESLIQEIALILLNNELLNTSDFRNVDDCTDEVENLITKALDGYVIVKGKVI